MTKSNAECCTNCGSNSVKTVDSRLQPTGIRERRKRCMVCDHRWTTFEITREEYNDLTNTRVSIKMDKLALRSGITDVDLIAKKLIKTASNLSTLVDQLQLHEAKPRKHL